MRALRLPLGLTLAAGVLAAGCVGPQPDIGGRSADPNARPRGGDLEVRVFQGGYGVDFYEGAAREYERSHPGVKIDLKGDPRIWEQLRPRFIAGDPPGLTFPGWGFDHFTYIVEGQVLPLDDVLLTTPYGETGGTWRDTFLPEILELGSFSLTEGGPKQTYLLPYYLNLNGWWYNVGLFEEKGWAPPRTYKELLALCPRIQAAGVAPLTYQGKYPAYALQGFLLPWAISDGGIEVLHRIERLEPGAWRHPSVRKAAGMIDDLREKGYLARGAEGLSHTEAQMDFLSGRAAMIPCGTWLESEMKEQKPAGFRMSFILPPYLSPGKGDPTTLQVGVEPWLIPARGPNQALAVDFFKYLTSRRKAREFILAKGTLTAVRGTSEDPLPEVLRGPARALTQARVTWTTRYAQWYKPLDEAAKTALSGLMIGKLTPDQFCDEVERAAEKIRNDPAIPKRQE